MGKQFDAIFEGAMSRFQRGGFLVGDCVEFNKAFKSSPSFKALNRDIQDKLGEMIDTGLNIRVVGISNKNPMRQPDFSENSNGEVVLNIAVDMGGGRYIDIVTIPADLVTTISHSPNLSPIPDKWTHDNNTDIEGTEVKPDPKSTTNKTDRGDGKLSKTDLDLPTKHVKIPAKPAKDVSYTAKYLED